MTNGISVAYSLAKTETEEMVIEVISQNGKEIRRIAYTKAQILEKKAALCKQVDEMLALFTPEPQA